MDIDDAVLTGYVDFETDLESFRENRTRQTEEYRKNSALKSEEDFITREEMLADFPRIANDIYRMSDAGITLYGSKVAAWHERNVCVVNRQYTINKSGKLKIIKPQLISDIIAVVICGIVPVLLSGFITFSIVSSDPNAPWFAYPFIGAINLGVAGALSGMLWSMTFEDKKIGARVPLRVSHKNIEKLYLEFLKVRNTMYDTLKKSLPPNGDNEAS